MKDLCQPQTGLLRYVLEQPYSREMVGNMLGLNKQVKTYLVFLKKKGGGALQHYYNRLQIFHFSIEKKGKFPSINKHGKWQEFKFGQQYIYFYIFLYVCFEVVITVKAYFFLKHRFWFLNGLQTHNYVLQGENTRKN